MSNPRPPPGASNIMALVDEAVGGIELEPAEKREVWRFTRQELPYLWSQRTSYFILGSYRDPYIRRLRKVQNELTKRLGSYPFIMGDLVGLSTERLNTFDIMFTVLATYSDYLVGVFEKESGGEATELGEIDDSPYFEKTYVLPRDYVWVTGSNHETKRHVIRAALEIAFADDSPTDDIQSEVSTLVGRAQTAGIEVTDQEVWDAIDDRGANDEVPSTYSWVHLNKFRKFELHDRCLPWSTEEELIIAVSELPPPTTRPSWEVNEDQ